MAAIRYSDVLEVSAKRDVYGDVKLVVSNLRDMDRDFTVVVIEGAAFCRCSNPDAGFLDKDYPVDYGIISDMIGSIADLGPNQTTAEPTDWVLSVINAYKRS